jgi:acyl-CoA thioesterase
MLEQWAGEGDLLRDSQVEQIGEGVRGQFRGYIPDAWRTVQASGGMTMAVALRAVQCVADDPRLRPIYASALFAKPVACGPVLIKVDVLTRGANMLHARAVLRNPEQEADALCVHAIFGQGYATPQQLRERQFPSGVFGPADAIRGDAKIVEGLPLLRQSETRWAHEFRCRPGGSTPADRRCGAEPAVASSWIRYCKPPMIREGHFDPILLPVPADVIASALFRGLGPDAGVFPVTLALDLHFIGEARSEWLLQEVRVSDFTDGLAHGDVALWDERRELVALATQRRLCKPASRR